MNENRSLFNISLSYTHNDDDDDLHLFIVYDLIQSYDYFPFLLLFSYYF